MDNIYNNKTELFLLINSLDAIMWHPSLERHRGAIDLAKHTIRERIEEIEDREQKSETIWVYLNPLERIYAQLEKKRKEIGSKWGVILDYALMCVMKEKLNIIEKAGELNSPALYQKISQLTNQCVAYTEEDLQDERNAIKFKYLNTLVNVADIIHKIENKESAEITKI